MSVDFPAHIVAKGFGYGIGLFTYIDCDMMFKTSSADIFHQLLKELPLFFLNLPCPQFEAQQLYPLRPVLCLPAIRLLRNSHGCNVIINFFFVSPS